MAERAVVFFKATGSLKELICERTTIIDEEEWLANKNWENLACSKHQKSKGQKVVNKDNADVQYSALLMPVIAHLGLVTVWNEGIVNKVILAVSTVPGAVLPKPIRVPMLGSVATSFQAAVKVREGKRAVTTEQSLRALHGKA